MTLKASLSTTANLSLNAVESDDKLLSKWKPLYRRYVIHVSSSLSKGTKGSSVYLSNINDLTLNEFVVVRKLYCRLHHGDATPEHCCRCRPLVQLSERINAAGICELSVVYRAVFSDVQYQSHKAIRKLMQLPVAIFKLELGGPGSQRLYVSEIRLRVDYDAFGQMCQMVLSSEVNKNKEKGLTKEALDVLCQLATTESDRCLIRYSVCKSQALSSKRAKKDYGFSDLHAKEDQIMKAIDHARSIRDAVMQLASVKHKATLTSLGYEFEDSGSSCSCDSEGSDLNQLISDSDESEDEHSSVNGSMATATSEENGCVEANVSQLLNSREGSNGKGNEGSNLNQLICDANKSDCEHGSVNGIKATTTSTESGCVEESANDLQNSCAEHSKRRGDVAIDPDSLKKDTVIVDPTPSMDHLLFMLRSNELNWFAFVEEPKMLLREFTPETLNVVLLDFAHYLSSTAIDRNEERLIEQSRQAYLEQERQRVVEETRDIVSDEESDNPDDWVDIDGITNERAKEMVTKQWKIQKRRARIAASKAIAKASLLKRKVTK